MKKQGNKIPDSAPRIQCLAPVIPAHRLRLLVRCQSHGSEGLAPVDDRECPYFQQYHVETTCISGSGGSFCGGFYGTTADGCHTKCAWFPRWTLPGQHFVVEFEADPTPAQRPAQWN